MPSAGYRHYEATPTRPRNRYQFSRGDDAHFVLVVLPAMRDDMPVVVFDRRDGIYLYVSRFEALALWEQGKP